MERLILLLSETRLFKGLNHQTLADLLDKVVYQVKHYQKGNVIASRNETCSSLFMLTETQQLLAEQFGVTRPSLARTLQELENEGLISVQNRQVTILSREGLARILG